MHIQIHYTANIGYSDYPHSTKDIHNLEGLVQSNGTVHIHIMQHNRNKKWIVDDISELEQRIEKGLGGRCKHTFRDWEFRDASVSDCECSIIGVTVDLMVEIQ